MPSDYLKSIEPNVGVFVRKDGTQRICCTNTNYRKKKRGGFVRGTGLTLFQVKEIHKLHRLGCTKKALCEQYNISRYYLRYVLDIPFDCL